MNDSDRERKREILERLKRPKHLLDRNIATNGRSSDPGVIIERDDLAKEIQTLEREIAIIPASLPSGFTRSPVRENKPCGKTCSLGESLWLHSGLH
jgi:hypothetical protein